MTPTADLLILNARVLTLDPGQPKATEIAVIDGKIAAVGAQGELASLRGPGTEVIDAGGGSVVPGFSENHMHLFSGSAELVHLQLSGVHGLAALTEAIRNYGKDRREQVMLFAQGADYTILGGEERLTRHHLDAIWPDQPRIISSSLPTASPLAASSASSSAAPRLPSPGKTVPSRRNSPAAGSNTNGPKR